MTNVIVAPVAAAVLASALTRPHLLEEVAFGTRQRDLDIEQGTPVYLYVAPDRSGFRSLLRPGFVTWTGILGPIVPAVAAGKRLGMHPDPSVRPPFAEAYDYRNAALFWHVTGLRALEEPVAFERFRDKDGAKLFGGLAPQWISRARLTGARDIAVVPAARRERMLRAA